MGVITRESVRDALMAGISGDQILRFLQQHSHPQMGAEGVPVNVIDQVRLWEHERKRMGHQDAVMYEGFASGAEFDALREQATVLGALLWSDPRSRIILAAASGDSALRDYVRKHISS